MENRYEHIDEVIARILAGEGSDADHSLLNEWLEVSEENKRSFRISKNLFEKSSEAKEILTVDTDRAWIKVKESLRQKQEYRKVISIVRYNKWSPALKIAAAILLLAGLSLTGYLLLTRNNISFDKTYASGDLIKHETLPDSSTITLNRNSSLAWSSRQFNQKRIVKLTGEAFFEVKHDDTNPFVVEAGTLKIEDVGTSFNIKAYPDSKVIIVTVATGEVRLYTRDGSGPELIAGETATFDIATGEFSKSLNEDKNIAAYKDKIFIFENTELQVIVKLLNDVYASHIVITGEEIKKCRLTASFRNERLDGILDVIAETLHLEVTRSESDIRLTGNACN